jgi:hypothetical protein
MWHDHVGERHDSEENPEIQFVEEHEVRQSLGKSSSAMK